MKLSLYIAASFLIANIQAATVQFNVICPDSKKVQVNVNGELTTLKPLSSNVPVYSGRVDVGSEKKYKYVSDGKAEDFQRTITSNSTYNEFFGRPITYADIPELPRPLDNGKQWARADTNPDLFDTNYIPTIFVNGDAKEMNDLIKNVPKTNYTVEVTFVGKDYVKTFDNVTLGISGAGKKNNPQKQSWRWILSPGDYINDRNVFKIRNMEEDPTQMREKLYADCLNAMGTYANRANMVRYFINGEGFGTFNLLDDIKFYSYIRAMFYDGHPPKQMGPLFDGATGASFALQPSQWDYGDFIPAVGSPEGSEAINQLALDFHNLDVTDNYAINRFEDIFDIDQFLRFMVMEYLGGSWDGYWMMQTNDGAYKDYANNNTWYYLGQDFDGTFGINLPVDVLDWSYTEYPPKYPDAVLINGFLKNDKLKSTFESYIVDTVKTLFNNDTLGEHIMAYRQFIAPDLKWDRSIKQQSPGKTFGWTYEQSYENLFEGVSLPIANRGGAQYGLTEWIKKKAQVVMKDFDFKL